MILNHLFALVAISGKKPSELPTPTAPIVASDIFVAEQADGIVVQTPLPAPSVADITRNLIPPSSFANRENPTDAEALSYIQGLADTPDEGSVFYANPGVVVNDSNGAQNPEIVWQWIDGNVLRVEDTPRVIDVPASAFSDIENPTVLEVSNHVNGTNYPDLSGNILIPKYTHTDGRVWKWIIAGSYEDTNNTEPNVTLVLEPAPKQEEWKEELFTLTQGQTSVIVANGSLPSNPAQLNVFINGNRAYNGDSEDYTYNPSTGEITWTQFMPNTGMKAYVNWVEYPAI